MLPLQHCKGNVYRHNLKIFFPVQSARSNQQFSIRNPPVIFVNLHFFALFGSKSSGLL